MAAIDTVYNYYLSTYGNSTQNRYDTHKKSELRSVYNSMIKVNKESPLYKIQGADTGEASRFAIDVKEASMNLVKTAMSLSTDGDATQGSFKKQAAASSNPELVAVNYIGDEDREGDLTETFSLEVKDLAKPQINASNILPETEKDIAPGQYTFDFENTSSAYEFSFTVGENDTNKSVQSKIARLMNKANIGVNAFVDSQDGDSQLIITSKETGLSDTEDFLFKISPSGDRASAKALDKLGIDYVAQEASNSSFLLNGSEHQSLSNTFTINKEFEVSLLGTSEEGEAVEIGFEDDVEAVYENVKKLISAYNAALQTASNYNTEGNQHTSKLIHNLSSVADSYKSTLENMGLSIGIDGYITINKEALSDAVSSDVGGAVYAELNNFKNAASAKANQIALNPMEYVNKVVVAYKNPGQGFNTPYSTSLYAGMMVDTTI